MIKKLKSPKKWILYSISTLVLLVGAATVAVKESQDPLDPEMTVLDKLADSVFLDPEKEFKVDEQGEYKSGSLLGFLDFKEGGKKDERVSVENPKFIKLLTEMRKMRKKIEDAADVRSEKVLAQINEAQLKADQDSKWKSTDPDQQKKLNDKKEKALTEKRNKLQDQTYGKFASIIVRYYLIQKRIFANQVKNAHYLELASLLNASLYDELNLKLNLPVAQFLVNNKELKLVYNMWHTRNPHSHEFDSVVLGMTPEEKGNVELSILEEKKDYNSYAKLINFLVIRERLVNQWAVDRMARSATTLSSVNLKSCGTDLIAFHDRSNAMIYSPGNYYDFLWKKDRYEEFAAVGLDKSQPKIKGDDEGGVCASLMNGKCIKPEDMHAPMIPTVTLAKVPAKEQTIVDIVIPTTINRSLFSEEQFHDELFKFFHSYRTFQDKVLVARATPTPTAIPTGSAAPVSGGMFGDIRAKLETKTEEAVREDASELVEVNLHDTYKSYFADQIMMNEASWASLAKASLLDANFMEDRWDDESVADRSTLYAYQFRRKFLIDVFFYQAQAQKLEVTYDVAARAVDASLAAIQPVWKKAQKDAILAALKSNEAKKIRMKFKDLRFNEKYEEVKPIILTSGQAEHTLSQIEGMKKSQRSKWKAAGKIYYDYDFELGYVGVREFYDGATKSWPLTQKVFAWAPEHLVKFYYGKLNYWSSKVDDNRSYLPILARQIQMDSRVMWGMSRFFEALTMNYKAALDEKKIAQADVNPDNTVLYDVVQAAAVKAYNDFLVEISKPPVVYKEKITPANDPRQNPRLAIQDNTYNKKAHEPVIMFGHYVDPAKRSDVIALFVQAMSVMNLGEMLTSNATGWDAYMTKGSDHQAVSLEKFQKYAQFRAPTFLKMEKVLRVANGFGDLRSEAKAGKIQSFVLKQRMFQSLLDQKIMAQGFIDKATELYPILAIQYDQNESRLDADMGDQTVLSLATASAFDPATGLDHDKAKNALTLGINKAVRSAYGLVTEACGAKPFVPNEEKFRKIFRGAKTLRSTYTNGDEEFTKLDEQLMKYTRTQNEALLEDYLDPIGKAIFYLFIAVAIIGLAIYCAPAAYGAIASIMATVGVGSGGVAGTAFLASIGTSISAVGAAVVVPGLTLAGIGTLVNLIVVPGFFAYQLITQYKVSSYELPAQLRYQLNISNSQVGSENSITQISKNDLRFLSAHIHTMQSSTKMNFAFQVLFLPSLAKMGKLALGLEGLATVERLAATAENGLGKMGKVGEVAGKVDEAVGSAARTADEAASGVKTALEEIKIKSRQQWIDELGELKGNASFAKQQALNFMKYGRFVVLETGITLQKTWNAVIPQFSKFYKTKQNLKDLLELKIAEIDVAATKHWEAISKSPMLRAETNGMITYTEAGKNFLESLKVKYGMNAKNFLFAIDPKVWENIESAAILQVDFIGDAVMQIQFLDKAGAVASKSVNIREAFVDAVGKVGPDGIKQADNLAAMAHYAALNDLAVAKTALLDMSYRLSGVVKGGQYIPEVAAESLDDFFVSLTVDETLQMRAFSEWVLMQQSNNVLGKEFFMFTRGSPEAMAFKQSLKDFDFMFGEAQLIQVKNLVHRRVVDAPQKESLTELDFESHPEEFAKVADDVKTALTGEFLQLKKFRDKFAADPTIARYKKPAAQYDVYRGQVMNNIQTLKGTKPLIDYFKSHRPDDVSALIIELKTHDLMDVKPRAHTPSFMDQFGPIMLALPPHTP